MNELLVLCAVVAGIWLLILLLRVPASIAFFSLLVGQLLATEASNDVYDFTGAILHLNEVRYVQVGLLVLPLILTILFMRGRVKKSQMVTEAIPTFFVALVAVLLAHPFIPELQTIVDSATQGKTDQYRSFIIIVASISGLFSAWMSYPKPHDKHAKRHNK